MEGQFPGNKIQSWGNGGKGVTYSSQVIQSFRNDSVHSFDGSFVQFLLLWCWICFLHILHRLPTPFQFLSRQSARQFIPLTPSPNLIAQRKLRGIRESRVRRLALTALLAHEIEWVKNDWHRRDDLGEVGQEGWEGKRFWFDSKGVDADEVCEKVGGSGEEGDGVGEEQVQKFTSDEECQAMDKHKDGANYRHRGIQNVFRDGGKEKQ